MLKRVKRTKKTSNRANEISRMSNALILPEAILFEPLLTSTEKIIYALVLATAGGEQGSFLSNTKINKLINVTQSVISRAYKKLEKMDLIRIELRGVERGTVRHVFLTHNSKKLISKNGGCKQIDYLYKESKPKGLDNKGTKEKSAQKVLKVLNVKNRSKKKTNIRQKNEVKNPFIEFWNTQAFVRKHERVQTKVYTQSSKLIKNLQTGKFSQYTFDPEWLKVNKFTPTFLGKEWKKQSIKNGLVACAQLFDPAYWPDDKQRLPADLPTLIYNPKTQKSLFLQFWKNPPRLLSESNHQTKMKPAEHNRGAKLIWKTLVDAADDGARIHMPPCHDAVERLYKLMIDNESNRSFTMQVKNLYSLVEDYCDYIQEHLNFRQGVRAQQVGALSEIMRGYIRELHKQFILDD